MRNATIKTELNIYISLLSARQQQLILDMIKNILHIDSKEKRISVEQYNAEIETSLGEIRKDKGISHDEVIKHSRKWLKRK